MNQLFERNGKPFFVLGGQAHNSTTYSAYDRGMFWKALDTLQANTAEIPVYWEAIEPQEDVFDFSTVDQLLLEAREHGKSLVLLWFGTWKNGNMRYVPAWVKTDTKRFRRVRSHDGNELFVLSSHYRENLEADKKAFCRLMEHLNAVNTDGTVIAVQVENEAGIAGRSYRDFSENGERDYLAPVPEGLMKVIEAAPGSDLYRQWEMHGLLYGKNWEETFGVKNGAENLTAYSIASYINEIALEGKKHSQIPLYTNVALDRNPWGWNLAGTNYTAGGPIPRLYEIWKYATPALEMLAPDIYFDCTRCMSRSAAVTATMKTHCLSRSREHMRKAATTKTCFMPSGNTARWVTRLSVSKISWMPKGTPTRHIGSSLTVSAVSAARCRCSGSTASPEKYTQWCRRNTRGDTFMRRKNTLSKLSILRSVIPITSTRRRRDRPAADGAW